MLTFKRDCVLRPGTFNDRVEFQLRPEHASPFVCVVQRALHLWIGVETTLLVRAVGPFDFRLPTAKVSKIKMQCVLTLLHVDWCSFSYSAHEALSNEGSQLSSCLCVDFSRQGLLPTGTSRWNFDQITLFESVCAASSYLLGEILRRKFIVLFSAKLFGLF